MKKTFQTTIIGFISSLMLCCGGTICDDAASYLIDDCGLSDDRDIEEVDSEVDCSDGTQVACISQCTLDAPCSVFDGSLDPTNEDDLSIMTDYSDCVLDC